MLAVVSTLFVFEIACFPCCPEVFILVFVNGTDTVKMDIMALTRLLHQSNRVCASICFSITAKSTFVFFQVSLCSLLLPCVLESTALREGVKTLYNTMQKLPNVQ